MLPIKRVFPCLAMAGALLPSAIRGADAGAWERTRMPGYASVRAFATVPAGLLAGTDRGGIYLTENEGADWKQVWKAPDDKLATSIRGFLAGDSVLLAASGTPAELGLWDCWGLGCVSPAGFGGILRSRDGGRTWSYAGLRAVTAMARVGNSAILAATLGGFYRSNDWGATWRPVTVTPDPGSSLTTASFQSMAVVEMASLGGDAYFTMWRPGLQRLYAPSPFPRDTAYRVQSILPGTVSVTGSGDTLFACSPTAMLRAQVQGWPAVRWDTLSRAALSRIVTAPGRLLALASPIPSNSVFTQEISQSVDGGRTWTPASPPGTDGLAFIQHKGYLYWGTAGGPVMRCPPGGAWTYASDGLQDMGVTGIALPGSAVLAMLEDSRILHRAAGPADPWSLSRRGVGLSSLAARGKHAFFIEGSQLWSSDQAGAPGSWTSLNLIRPQSVIAGDGWQLILQADGRRTLCGSGACEAPITGDLPAQFYNGLGIRNDLSAAATAGDTVYLALDSLYRSCDRGRSFEYMSPFQPTALAVVGGKLYALSAYFPGGGGELPSRPHVIVSADGGRTWERGVEAGIMGQMTLRFLASRPGELFCASDSGIFALEDGATRWTDLSAGLPSRKIRALAVEGDRLAVAGDSGPVWLLALQPGPTALRARARAGKHPARLRAYGDGKGRWRRIDGAMR